MAECTIFEACPRHIQEIAPLLRDDDAAECAAAGVTNREALWASYRASGYRKAAFIRGDLAAVYGISGSVLGGRGSGWLLTTAACAQNQLTFVKTFRRELAGVMPVFPYIYGYVADSYTASKRLLQMLGFSLGEPKPMGISGAPFRRFEIGDRKWA